MMDALLSDHLDMLFGQHVSVAIACALFFTVSLRGVPGKTSGGIRGGGTLSETASQPN